MIIDKAAFGFDLHDSKGFHVPEKCKAKFDE